MDVRRCDEASWSQRLWLVVLPSPLYLRRVKNEGGHFGSHSPLTCHRFLLRYNRGRLRVGVIDWSGIR
jgi:hypothetical protein